MGYNLKVLAERAVDQTLYYEHGCNLELRECIHDHVEDFRMIYTEEEFLKMSDHWIAARKKYEEMGRPECHPDRMDGLSTLILDGDRLHHDRFAVEFVRGGAEKDGGGDTLHVHYRNQRMHLTKRDFYRMALAMEEARRSYNQDYSEEVRLSDPQVTLRQVASETYVPWLEEYIADESIPRADANDFWDLFLEVKKLTRPEDDQRPDGGWTQDVPRTRTVPEDVNKRYLYTVYECIKKYGYGRGPFKYDYVRAHVNKDTGLLEITGSHRAAALKVLGYDTITVTVTN
jgi:hypothetical protein